MIGYQIQNSKFKIQNLHLIYVVLVHFCVWCVYGPELQVAQCSIMGTCLCITAGKVP